MMVYEAIVRWDVFRETLMGVRGQGVSLQCVPLSYIQYMYSLHTVSYSCYAANMRTSQKLSLHPARTPSMEDYA